MNDAVLERLNRLERESRVWKFACFGLLAAVIAVGVRAQTPPDQQTARGNFESITAGSITVNALLVKGQVSVVKSDGNWGQTSVTLNATPNPSITMNDGSSIIYQTIGPNARISLGKGNSGVEMTATDSSGQMSMTDSSGATIMRFPLVRQP
jgi:hypothetical protein